jgi:hypothetical protein
VAPPFILARNYSEAQRFALHELGLGKGHYRLVTSTSSISGRRNTDLYLVPGWERRADRFALKSALRYTRLNLIDVAELRKRGATDDGLNPPGVQPTLDEDLFFAEIDTMIAEGGPVAPEEPQSLVSLITNGEHETEESLRNAAIEEIAVDLPVKRRRRRCKECGTLVEPGDVEQHAAEHLPVGE